MSDALPVDAVALRDEVRAKYREVAVNPHGGFHFHTGRPLARHLDYDEAAVAGTPRAPSKRLRELATRSPTVH
ncbi:MAG TPA: hypothetical protein VG407_02050 [Caulobacteraceae bacterium]|nr:hypothetical protein [Caulobacteraceae bacterium]